MLKLKKLHLPRGNQQNGTCLFYISILLVTMSNDVQLNPGPITPKYPCGSCGAAVKNNQNSIQCDGCDSWYHIECQGMNESIHQVLAEHAKYSWSYLKCGLPNFNTTLFDDLLSTYCSSNSFSQGHSIELVLAYLKPVPCLSPKTSTPLKRKITSLQVKTKSKF